MKECLVSVWEQRKLRDVLTLLKDGTHGTHKDTESGPLLLSAKNIKNGIVQWDESDRRISVDEYKSIHANFELQDGDVLLTIVGSIGETAILSHSEGITFQRSVAFLRPSNEIISEFLYSEIQGHEFQKELNDRKSTSAQPGIYLGDLGEIPINYPINIDEQTAIGQCFTTLDHLITLHQRKQLYWLKVGKYDWEQRKVGDITKELSEYAKLSSGLPLLTSARTGLMYQSDYRGNSTTDNENTLFSIVPLNACTYRHMSDDSTFHINVNTLEKGLVSKEYPVFVENESDLRFVVQYINSSDSFTKFCTEQKKGGTRTRLYYKTLCEYKMLIPSLNEQHIIADYFDNLDSLITLHQQK